MVYICLQNFNDLLKHCWSLMQNKWYKQVWCFAFQTTWCLLHLKKWHEHDKKIWNIWPVRCTHKTLRPLCTFRPHEYCLIGKEENKVTIKQASWFIPGTVVCILTRSWEKSCNRVKGLLKVVMKVFLGGGGGGGMNLIKQCSLLIQQNSYFLVTVTVC